MKSPYMFLIIGLILASFFCLFSSAMAFIYSPGLSFKYLGAAVFIALLATALFYIYRAAED